jgi:hypothetical protein
MSRMESKASSIVRPSVALPSSVSWSNTMKMVGCKEMYAEFHVDPTVARQHVPAEYEVRIHQNGKAMLLLMVQDCDKCVLNSIVLISPMRMSHIWIELAGPEEVGPALPGTTASLPTRYYYALPHQIDNALAHRALWLAGIDVQKVKQVSLGGDPGGIRQGMVVEQEYPTKSFSWEESSILWPSPSLVTGRRWFYRHYGRFIKRRSEGLVVCSSSFLGEGEVQLQAGDGSRICSLGFGTTLSGVTNPVKINYCNVRIRVLGR